jgi:cysteine desulfurase
VSVSVPLYLDYAATTPVDERVANTMHECLTRSGIFGNPASMHEYGQRARARVEQARAQCAALLRCRSGDLIFTSGATESNNLAVLGTVRAAGKRGRHVVSSRIEHKSVLDACKRLEQEGFSVSYLRPDRVGVITPEAVAAALRADTALVSLMHANNEIGVVQDIHAIGSVCHSRGVPLHVDAAQSVGKIDVDVIGLGADLLSFTAHKLYGPKGIGALYVTAQQRVSLQPLLYGGGQERGVRPGTLAVHQIVGFGTACDLMRAELPNERVRIEALRSRLWRGLSAIEGARLNGHETARVPGILNVSFPGIEGESLLLGLQELAVSTGSACNSETDEPSHVLSAIGHDAELAQSSVRFSLGRFSCEAEIDLAIAAVRREVLRLRAASPS